MFLLTAPWTLTTWVVAFSVVSGATASKALSQERSARLRGIEWPPSPPSPSSWPLLPTFKPTPSGPWSCPPWQESKSVASPGVGTMSQGTRSASSTRPSSTSAGPTIGQAVNTTSGIVQGHPAPNASEVSEYLGIPYAVPPLDDLRFAPPVRYNGSGHLSGLSTNRICIQATPVSFSGSDSSLNLSSFPAFLIAQSGLDQTQSEDCLTLNVWTKPQTGSAKKPVMVWIYGGGFATGNSNSTLYSGQHWADEEDVVFVNFNYRLGIYGFSGAPDLTQNVGLLDQRLAIEWVGDNIAAFGGDPNRIIIFGESAGGASTDYYTYAWTEDPIIAGSIHESGQATSFGNNDPDSQAALWYQASTKAGCGNLSTSTAADITSCMRTVPATNLTDSTRGLGPGISISIILSPFRPTVDNITVFDNYTQRIVDGSFIQKPALIGSNDNEGGLFIYLFALTGLNIDQGTADVITSGIFTCPSLTAAYARYLHNLPVWRYRYFPSFPNIQVSTSIGTAYHEAEIAPLFGTSVEASGQNATVVEDQLGAYLRNAWATFAHDPTSGLGDSPLQWPQFAPDANSTDGLVLLGRNNRTTAEFSVRGAYDGACPLL